LILSKAVIRQGLGSVLRGRQRAAYFLYFWRLRSAGGICSYTARQGGGQKKRKSP